MTAIRLPDSIWGDAEGEALLDRWLVEEGATVREGEPVANAVLVKSNLEVTAPADGKLVKILVAAGESFARGQDLAMIEEQS